jgi:hypothetical protein
MIQKLGHTGWVISMKSTWHLVLGGLRRAYLGFGCAASREEPTAERLVVVAIAM